VKPRSLNDAQRDLYLRVAASREMEDPAYTEDFPADWPDAPPPCPSIYRDPVRPEPVEGQAPKRDLWMTRLAAAWLFLGASLCAFAASILLR